jgi:predicted kinase
VITSAQPLLLVVAGRPGSGKTTLAHALARAIRCPAICRDEIKEGFSNTTGDNGGDEVGRKVYEVFFDAVRLLIERQVTLVAEAAFQHKLWAPKLEPLRAIARIRIVVCDIDPQFAEARHTARGQADPLREWYPKRWSNEQGFDPPHLEVPTMTVDTTDGYRPDLDAIVAFVRG